jgi:hypothetical protein
MDIFSQLLTTDGILVIAVPNCSSWNAKVYKSQWVAYDAPRHLYHFRPQDMIRFLEKHRFRVISKHRLLFDTWFNALLSWELESTVYEKKYHISGLIESGLVSLIALIQELIQVDSSSSLVYMATKISV